MARVPLLVSFSLALFAAAWCIGNPPSAGPDEVDHYVSALAAGGFDLRGRPPGSQYTTYIKRQEAQAQRAGDTRRVEQHRWIFRTAREFTVPAHFMLSSFACASGKPRRSWACLDDGRPSTDGPARPTAAEGTYPPFVYIPSGLLMRTADDGQSAFRLGRLVGAGISVALLSAAAFLLWSPAAGAVSLSGFMLTVTPMVLFLGSIVSASGPEIASSVCFTAALIRLSRASIPGRWVWLALGGSGAVLALSRPLGPVFPVFIVLALAVLVGPARLLESVKAGAAAMTAWLAVAAALGAALLWGIAYGARPEYGAADVLGEVPSSVKELPHVLREAVGYFGPLDSPLPRPAFFLWLLALAALIVWALVIADRRGRLGLGLLGAGVLGAAMLGMSAVLATGFVPAARHVLPLLVVVPLCAGELLSRRAEQTPDARLDVFALGVAVLAPCVQAIGWYANGRRVAVGSDGSWLFPFEADWSPPAGWVPWVVLVGVATATYLIAGIAAARPGAERARPREAVLTAG